MQSAMVVAWKMPFPGREIKALEYGAEVMGFWTEQAEAGKCTKPELFFSDRGTGLWMVKGERDVLEGIALSERGLQLEVKGQLLLEDFSIDFMVTGEAADQYMARYGSLVASVV